MIATFLSKRALPFVLTLIFGTGLGSIFGGSSNSSMSPRTEVAPSFKPARTYKGCSSRGRHLENTTPSQNGQSSTTPTRNDPTLISR
jgi:hypothetical protein